MEEFVSKHQRNKGISVENLCKSYNAVPVIQNLSFEVNTGEMFGLIGPDGAGKTTLFRILTTLLLPDKGSGYVGGWDLLKEYRNIRESVGYMPGHFSLYPDLTVEENLHFFATLFGTTIQQNYQLIAPIYDRLLPFAKRKAAALSGGMKQKLALCCALIHKPTVLFLDEPTTGVDPVSRMEFWNNLKQLQKEGIAILVSTPYMDEADICDRIALMKDGAFLKVGSPAEIKMQYNDSLWSMKARDLGRLLFYLRKCPEIKSCFSFGDCLHVVFNPNINPELFLSNLIKDGWENTTMEMLSPHIEDCFIKFTQA